MSDMARGEFEGLEDFLSDRERDRGGFEGILKWKKKDPPALNAWMSMRRKPIKVCRHNFPTVVSFTDKETKEQVSKVFTWRGGCFEPLDVVENQNWRNKDTGERVLKYEGGKKVAGPPETCPQCLLVEYLRPLVLDGLLGRGFAPFSWKEKGLEVTEQANYSLVEPLFRLKGEDDEEERVVTAGGFCNLLKPKKKPDSNFGLDAADLKLLAKQGIQLTESWKENGCAGTNYLFTVADNDDIASGLHKAVEAKQLGEAVIKVIAEAMKGSPKNPEKWNPFKNPYCIRFEHRPKGLPENPFQKYTAFRVDPDEAPLTDEIREVLQSDPPDVTEETSYLNPDELRTMMEACCVLKGIPWDEIFKHRAPGEPARSDSAKPASPKPKEEKAAAPKEEPKARDPKNPLGLDEASDDTCTCECPVKEGSEEQCGGLMRVSDDTCAVCGAVYDLKSDPVSLVKRPWDKPKSSSRGRSAASALKAEAKGEKKGGPAGGGSDTIPF